MTFWGIIITTVMIEIILALIHVTYPINDKNYTGPK